MRYFIFSTLLLFFGVSIADNSAHSPNKASPFITVTCPPIQALTKNQKMEWSAKGGWKSYGTSFVEKIASFSGAQWNGVNLGQIICVYNGKEKTDFPVLLVYHTLAIEPQENGWSKNLGGYRNCTQKNQKNCTFNVKRKTKSGNIYQEAEQLKYDNNRLSNPGY